MNKLLNSNFGLLIHFLLTFGLLYYFLDVKSTTISDFANQKKAEVSNYVESKVESKVSNVKKT